MVKLKKVLVMALSFVMAMTAFVACGGDKESTESGNSATESGSGNESTESGGNGGNSEEQLPVGEQVTAEEWNAAIAATEAETNFTVEATWSMYNGTEETGTKIGKRTATEKIADDKYYNQGTQVSVENQTMSIDLYEYGANVGGACHFWRSVNGIDWGYVDSYGDPEDYFTGNHITNSIDRFRLTFNDFTYDTEMGAYKYVYKEEGGSGYIYVGITDGKVSFMITYTSYTAEDGTQSYTRSNKSEVTITYGNAKVDDPADLPAIPSGGDSESTESGGGNGGNSEEQLPVGEQVTAEEWNAAIAATEAETNFTVEATWSMYNGTEETGTKIGKRTATEKIADDKYYNQGTQVSVENQTMSIDLYEYGANVGGACHFWRSVNGIDWGYVDSYGDPEDYFTGNHITNSIDRFRLTFNDFTYDTEMGAYKYVYTEEGESGYIYVGITDGKISFMITYTSYTEEDGTRSYKNETTITYGNAKVDEPADLPAIPSEA